VALAFYVAAAVAIFGRGVVASPTRRIVGDNGADKTIFIWAFRWWPHALAQAHDPFDANVVWVPHGFDLAWSTAVPLLSLALLPVTATAGAVAAYNVAVLAAPALSAWTAYLLARYVTQEFWPSLAGGWLFGFSAFEVGQMVGHLNLVFLAFLPLGVLLTLKHLNGDAGDRAFVVALALVLAAQFLTSTEIFVDLLLFGATFAAAAALAAPALRDALRTTAIRALAAVGLCLVLVSPYLWHAFFVAGLNYAPVRAPFSESADLLNYVVPTRRIELQLPGSHSIANRFTATGAERGAYLGLPLILLTVLYFWERRRSRTARTVALGLAALVVASLGAWVHVAGRRTVPAPWRLPAGLPLTRTLLPVRLTAFVALVVAIVAAAWLTKPSRWRWLLAVLAIVFTFPNPTGHLWSSQVPYPRFFSDPATAPDIPRGSSILVLPFGGAGWSLAWQAEDRFAYRLVGGHLGRQITPAEEPWSPVYMALGKGPSPPSIEPQFRAFLTHHHVALIIVAPGATARSQRLVARLGLRSTRTDDVLIYRVR
jgi:hypothetical protein